MTKASDLTSLENISTEMISANLTTAMDGLCKFNFLTRYSTSNTRQ